MTQQQLFDKLTTLLEPAGYCMHLDGNWRYGEVLFNVRHFSIFAHAFTHNNLLEEIADSLAFMKESAEEDGEEIDEAKVAFLYTLQAALETFTVDERNTEIHYTFDQPLFDFLKETLAADNIELIYELDEEDERYSYVYFEAKLPHLQFRVFPIYGRCFDVEGLEREVSMTGGDRIVLLHGKKPAFGRALMAIKKRVQQYREKLLLDEAKQLVEKPGHQLDI